MTATPVISAGAVNSGLFQMLVGKMLESGDLSGLKFTLVNAAKDVRYYTHFTESMMLPSTLGEAVHQSLVTATALGLGDKYVPSLIEAQEKLAGVSMTHIPYKGSSQAHADMLGGQAQIMFDTTSSGPENSASTLPSRRLRTHPSTACAVACCSTQYR